MYRVYTGPQGSDVPSPLDRKKMLYKEVASFDEALEWARHTASTGRTALLIESDDGTVFSKEEIAKALAHPH